MQELSGKEVSTGVRLDLVLKCIVVAPLER